MPLDRNITKPATPLILRDVPGADRVLTADALAFLAELDANFSGQVRALLNAREYCQQQYDGGQLPEFLTETQDIRDGDWTAMPVPDALLDRRVEITGPVDRKTIINALNCGAKVFMADFEDASSPRFDTMIDGQSNLLDYRDNALSFTDPKTGKTYETAEKTALLLVRPRGLHLKEANVLIDGQAMPAALFDFGLHFFHNAKALHASGRGPFYYLPKLENHREARLWANVFKWAEERVGLPKGTVKATVLIETLRAAFEMDEIIWELQANIAGLNCGRWDYIFSYIKSLRAHSDFVLPDRAQVTMDQAFLSAYATLLIETCHRRGIHAMGGMAAQIPARDDAYQTAQAAEKVRADKTREAQLGHDGTWVAHPALVPIALEVFEAQFEGPNQIDKPLTGARRSEAKLLEPHTGSVTEEGAIANISIALEYLSNWLCGRGAVAINNLMEDAATAEISRMQLWQWIKHGAMVECIDGSLRRFDTVWFGTLVQNEVARVLEKHGTTGFHQGHYASALRLLADAVTAKTPPSFITTSAYDVLNVLD